MGLWLKLKGRQVEVITVNDPRIRPRLPFWADALLIPLLAIAAAFVWMVVELNVPTAGNPEERPFGAHCTTQGPLFVAGILCLLATTFGTVVWRVVRHKRSVLFGFFLVTLTMVFVAICFWVEFFAITVRDGCFAS